MTLTTCPWISKSPSMLEPVKYRVIGPCAVHNNDPGSIVEPDADWDVAWLVSTGHLEACDKPAQKQSKSDPEDGDVNA